MASAEMKEKRILPPVTLAESYKLSEQVASRKFGSSRWMVSNLPRDMRPYFNAVMALTARSWRLCDIHTGNAARQDLLEDLREDFRNNFMEEESTDQFPALLDTMKRHSIPQQYLHDIVASADMCVRIDRFSSFDQWKQLGCRIGGGTILSLVHVVGFEKGGFEPAAIQCGQAIFLTHLLNDIADEIQKLEYFLPADDVESFGVNLKKHNPAKPSLAIKQIFRFLIGQIEELFHHGGHVVNYLNLDGQRVLKSAICAYWNLLMKIKVEPEIFFKEQTSLSPRELFGLKLKHMLGLEGGVVVIPDKPHGH